MSKKRKHRHSFQKRPPGQLTPGPLASSRQLTPAELRQDGWRAFQAGHYAAAINVWEKLDLSDESLAAALAEAHFRQAAVAGLGPAALPHLERATALAPSDPIYSYYFGLALHKTGRTAEALEAYRRATANGLTHRGAGRVMALAALELDPHTDIAAMPDLSPEDRLWLEPLANFLQGKPQPQQPQSLLDKITDRLKIIPVSPLRLVFNGLVLLADKKIPEARQALLNIEGKSLPRGVNAVRWYYIGVGAAHTGDMVQATQAWKQAQRLHPSLPGLCNNLAAAYARQSASHAEAGNWAAAAQNALEGLEVLPGNTMLGHLAVVALDRAAHDAAQTGDWNTAAQQWAKARQALGNLNGVSPRPILHNLALAYEALGQWENAADAWRAMLRTKPRKKPKEGFSEEHWTWVRKHVIDCYRQAGRPDEAITIFRQALKTAPDDTEMYLGLVEALLANNQQQTAIGELNKLLKKHPRNLAALSRLAELYGESGDWRSAETTIRQALDIEPDNQDLQRLMAHVLSELGNQLNWEGQYTQALAKYEQALKYAPDDYNIYINLARVEFNQKKSDLARQHLEHALELGKDKPDAYEQAFVCWIIENKLNEARNILARAEATGKLTSDFYVHTGVGCIQHSVPPPDMANPFDWLMGRRSPRRPPSRKELRPDARLALGQELLERAIALGPEVVVLRHIVNEMGPAHPELSIPYAQRLAKLTPDALEAWLPLGLLYGLNGQVKEAQEALRQAERLARKQGQNEMAREIKELSRAVADPFFGSMVSMLPFLDI